MLKLWVADQSLEPAGPLAHTRQEGVLPTGRDSVMVYCEPFTGVFSRNELKLLAVETWMVYPVAPLTSPQSKETGLAAVPRFVGDTSTGAVILAFTTQTADQAGGEEIRSLQLDEALQYRPIVMPSTL